MPNLTNAKKALRQNLKRQSKNLAAKTEIKKMIKNARSLIAAKKDLAKAETLVREIGKKLDKIAKTGYFKKNKSSRLKSRLAKALNKSKKG